MECSLLQEVIDGASRFNKAGLEECEVVLNKMRAAGVYPDR
jgi:hypothetical protein